MFDSKISLRAMANTAAVRFASAAERCYQKDHEFTLRTLDSFNELSNEVDRAPVDINGERELTIYQRTQLLGALWASLNAQCLAAGDSKFDAPMTLSDAYSLVVYGAILTRDERKQAGTRYEARLVREAADEVRANMETLVLTNLISKEQAEKRLPARLATSEAEVRTEHARRVEEFEAVLEYMNSIPTYVELGEDEEAVAHLLARLPSEERRDWYTRALIKVSEAMEKTIDKLFSTKIPAKAKSDMRAELPLLKADIQYLEQLCH